MNESQAEVEGRHGHSADVRMHLLLNGRVVPIAQLGPDFLILDHPVEHPPAFADIVLKVDEHERRWTVRLPDGLVAGRKRVRIARIES